MNERNAGLKAFADVVNLYVEGPDNGNIESLQKAFHRGTMMYGISSKAATIVEIGGFAGFVSANCPAKPISKPADLTKDKILTSKPRPTLNFYFM